MPAIRYVGRSVASAALGLIVIGLGIEAGRFAGHWWSARHG
jgi:formate hydrogenlyase subunit 3/multisubunit Na+/H+ antiporter MnhD subunit